VDHLRQSLGATQLQSRMQLLEELMAQVLSSSSLLLSSLELSDTTIYEP